MKARVLNAEADGYSEVARGLVAEVADYRGGAFDRPALLGALAEADALIVRLGHMVDAELLAAAPRLRVVVSATTGLDHIDLEAAAARGIAVLSLRGETAFLETIHATAEHTWALLLALLRRIPAASRDVAAGGWRREFFRGRELHGRRLGLVGLGRVGRQVAGYGLAFGMEVAACDPSPALFPEGITRRAGLDPLLEGSDVVCLHAPLEPSTRGMIGARELALLPAGAVLVNTARGALVDEDALAAALRGGRLAGAALDVLTAEQSAEARARSPLLKLLADPDVAPRLLITPHLAGATYDSMAKTEIFMARRLAEFLRDSSRECST